MKNFRALQREVAKLLNERSPESEADRAFWFGVWKLDALRERVEQRLRAAGCPDPHSGLTVLVILEREAARLNLAANGKVRRAAQELLDALDVVRYSRRPEAASEVIEATVRTASPLPGAVNAKSNEDWFQEGCTLLDENLSAAVLRAKSLILAMWGVPRECNGMPQRPQGEPPPVELPAWLDALTDDELREYAADEPTEPADSLPETSPCLTP